MVTLFAATSEVIGETNRLFELVRWLTGWEECLLNDLQCVVWDVIKPSYIIAYRIMCLRSQCRDCWLNCDFVCLCIHSGGCALQRESSWTRACRDLASSTHSTVYSEHTLVCTLNTHSVVYSEHTVTLLWTLNTLCCVLWTHILLWSLNTFCCVLWTHTVLCTLNTNSIVDSEHSLLCSTLNTHSAVDSEHKLYCVLWTLRQCVLC